MKSAAPFPFFLQMTQSLTLVLSLGAKSVFKRKHIATLKLPEI